MSENTNNRPSSVLLSEVRRVRSANAFAMLTVANDERAPVTITATTAVLTGFLGGEVR